MGDNSSQLPIALRRSPRHSAVRLHDSSSPSQRRPRQHAVSKAIGTPKQTKKSRAPIANSIIVRDVQDEPMTPPTTGRQRSVRRAIPTIKRRKYAKAPSLATPDKTLRNGYASYETTPVSTEVRIFPLRAILDDRVKRRIRRNGLSEEMNTIYKERKQRAQKNEEEMQSLRVQLADKEHENDVLREQSSLLQDTSRIEELEREISDLRRGLHSNNFDNVDDDWDMSAADGFTDGGSISDLDDRFRDDTTLEVESAGSGYHGKETTYIDTLKAFTPPATSPTRTASSEGLLHPLSVPQSDVGVQATLGEESQTRLEEELTQLRHELISLQKTLETKEQLESQTKANDMPMQDADTTDEIDPDFQLQTDIMLQTLAEKTEALTSLTSLVSTLGSPGEDASEIVSTLKDTFHCARQELEQIFPDEKPTHMSSEGTVVLHSMVQRLRESATQAKKDEALLESYCIREQHLREQLDDRMDAMDTMSSKLREKDDRIFRLEADMERSEVIINDYRKDLAEARHDLEQSNAELIDIQANLGSMISVTTDLQAQLAQLQVDKEVESAACRSVYDEELKMRDARLDELNKEIKDLKDALTLAHESTSKLQSENERLQGVADRDKKAARDTVTALRTQLIQSLQTSEPFLA